ncbi:MAG: hypothetical protein IJ986_01195, partial [Bacteroidales bacterium]|nr:hypothetical protein [Bacteroidales bacterium]
MKRALSIFFLSAMLLAFLGEKLQAQCVYTIQMHDSYGDGWNGGYITVNGTTYTCSGSSTTAAVTLTHGVSASFVWTSGSWDSEVSYSILDPDGNVVYSASSPSNGQTFTVTPYCVEEDESGYVVIGSGTSTNYNLPSYIYRAYAMSEQIYTAEEIGEVGDITSISYYDNSSNTATRSVDIYMMMTDRQTFSSTSDWIVPTVSDRVFSGSVTFRHGWVKIELDEPFYYDGTGNLLVVFDDNTGISTTSHPFYTYSTGEYRAIYTGGASNVAINSLPPSSYTDLSRTSSNNQIRLEIGPHQVGVGSGSTTASYIPTNTCSSYSLSEQIFTASEIGSEAALIRSISFNASSASSSSNNNRNWTIYLKNVGSQTTFSGGSSWLDLADAAMVYAGTVDCRSNGWVTITFDEPFYFNGHDNVAVIVDDNTGVTACTNYWSVDSKSNAAIYYNGGTHANPTSPSVSGSLYGYRNQVRFGLEYPEVLPAPTLSNPVVTGNTTVPCGGTAVLTASGVASDNDFPIRYLWYADPDGLRLLHEGATFDVTNITADRTVYVRAINGVNAEPQDFDYTGSAQTYTVPGGVTQVRLQVWGAQGGTYSSSYPGGKGGYSAGTLSVTGGDQLNVYVGGQANGNTGGFNGGGAGKTYNYSYSTYSYGGGGGTDIRVNGSSLYNRVIVAGGGSGGTSRGSGNYGGGTSGGYYSYSSLSGTQSSAGSNGSFGVGASAVASYNYNYGPGGGGGGWYGGGSYSSSSDSYSYYSRYSGGGSGYVNTSSSYHPSGYLLNSSEYYLTNTTLAAGNTSFESPTGGSETGHAGNGFARITPIVPDSYSVSELVPVTIHFTLPQTPVVVSSPSCQGEEVTVSVENPVEGLTYGWFTSSDCNAHSLIYEGSEYTTTLNATTTLYVRSYSGTMADPSNMVYNFTYSGDGEDFTVPTGVTQVKLEVWGAQGGYYPGYPSKGGKGGYSTGTLQVTPGETLHVYVGESGSSANGYAAFNGGGGYYSSRNAYCSGGGATDIRVGGNTLYDRIIVAGGGGGQSYYSSTSYTSYWMSGGAGGGASGVIGGYYSYRRGGYQGTATSGGNGYNYNSTYGQFG